MPLDSDIQQKQTGILEDVVTVPLGSGLETTWRSILVGGLASLMLIAVGVADTVGLRYVELTGLYLIIPLFVALRFRSRMFYPVATVSALSYVSSQLAVGLSEHANKESLLVVAINMFVQLTVAGALVALVQTLNIVQRTAVTDFLTGTLNRRGMDEFAPRLMSYAAAKRISMAAIVIDVDNFKALNDTYGHDAGDQVLQAVGEVLTSTRKRNTLIVRTGGDEFLVLMAVHSDHEAQAMARSLRKRLRDRLAKLGLPASASVGIAVVKRIPDSLEVLLQMADAKMYQAKTRVRAVVNAREYVA